MPSALLTEADNSTSLSLSVGDIVSLTLPENPTTGHRWQLDSLDSRVISASGDRFENQGAQVGGGGKRTLLFRILQPGKTRLSLKLRRPWESPDRFVKEFAVDLDVKS